MIKGNTDSGQNIWFVKQGYNINCGFAKQFLNFDE